jgi:redox-sensitive bicupin YhaK (pirin superfamily)
MKIYRKKDLGRFQNEWLNAHHHFSFGHYYDPKRMGFGNLRVINDDLIAAGQGFDPHPHKNMEIITYVREGSVVHRDSLGNEGVTKAGDVQVMSAGTGITHAEYSDKNNPTKLFQIWILPREENVTPRWDQAEFPHAPANENLKLLVTGRDIHKDQIDASQVLYIHQDASIYGGIVEKGNQISHQSHSGQSYVIVSKGDVTIDGQTLSEGDGAEIENQSSLAITAQTDAEILIIDL